MLCPIFSFSYKIKKMHLNFQRPHTNENQRLTHIGVSQISTNLNTDFHNNYKETSDVTHRGICTHTLVRSIAAKLERQEPTLWVLCIILNIYLLSYSSFYNSLVQKYSVKIPQKIWCLLHLSFVNILLDTLPSGALHH